MPGEHLVDDVVERVEPGAAVVAVHRAQEVAAIVALGPQQPRQPGAHVAESRGLLGRRELLEAQPEVGLDHVRRQQRAVHVEERRHLLAAHRRELAGVGTLPLAPDLVHLAHRLGDRGAVHLLEVVLPVDDRGVEPERLAVRLRQAREERLGVRVGEPQVGGEVLLVQVEVAAQELQPASLHVELAGQVAGAVAARRVADHVVGHLVRALAGGEQPLGRTGTGEPPVGQPHRTAVAGLERVVVEVLARVVVERAERERVAVAGGDVEVRRRARLGRRGHHGDDGRHDVVDRHDVGDVVGGARELGELATAVGQDQRLGHLEALDPARVGLLERRLDDARPHDRHPAAQPGVGLDDPLAQGLGEGVAVGPAEAAGALGAEPHQLLLHPLLALLLGGRGRRQQAGTAVLLLGLGAGLGQALPAARLVLDALALRETPRQLGLDVDVVRHRALGDHAPPPAGDVGRGDVHVVHLAVVLVADLLDPGEQPAGADHVGDEGLVDRRVERHVARAVHDGVGVGGQCRHVGHVALEHVHPLRERLDVGDLGEDRLGQQGGDPVDRTGGAARAHHHRHPAARHVGEQPLQQRLAHEPGDPGQDDVGTVETLDDPGSLRHGTLLRSGHRET